MKTTAVTALCVLTIILALFGAESIYSSLQSPELSANIEEWTTEQLEDQQFDYIDAIEVIKDEQRRRERLAARNAQ